jgi:hypothetical protein
LTQTNLAGLFGHSDDWKTDLAHPQVHETVHVLTGSFAKRRPQVVGGGVRVLMRLQVIGDTLKEYLLTQVSAQHADDGASLEVADVVEYLVNL